VWLRQIRVALPSRWSARNISTVKRIWPRFSWVRKLTAVVEGNEIADHNLLSWKWGGHEVWSAWPWCIYLKLKITQEIDLKLIYETRNINIKCDSFTSRVCWQPLLRTSETLGVYFVRKDCSASYHDSFFNELNHTSAFLFRYICVHKQILPLISWLYLQQNSVLLVTLWTATSGDRGTYYHMLGLLRDL
jgi:hypothetical protein